MSLLQVLPLGGVGEIGKNCTVVRQGDDIVVIDCGLSFPDEEQLGIDIIIPNFQYLLDNRDKIRGIFLTHAHEDHVGGLPFLLRDIKVPVFMSEFTHSLIGYRLEEKVSKEKLDLRVFRLGDVIEAGSLSVEPVRITHSMPENCAMAVKSQHGYLLFTGDFKLDFTPVDGKLTNITRFSELGRDGVLALFSDSTNVDRDGWGPSERTVMSGLRTAFANATGRIFLTTFASNIHRMQQAIELAAETGRKVAVVGRRMEQNLDICERMGYVKFPRGTRIPFQELRFHEDDKLVILCTGSQGEGRSALVQMSKGEYGRLQMKPGDTLLYSARPIPGNEGPIWRTINRLFEMGVNVLYEPEHGIHVSGHGYQEELKMMINLTRPYYLAPVHGEPRHQKHYTELARKMGYPEHRVFTMKNGLALEFTENDARLGASFPASDVLIDRGGAVGVTDAVLQERTIAANEGVVTVAVALDASTGAVRGDVQVSACGYSGPPEALLSAQSWVVDALGQLSDAEMKDPARVEGEIVEAARRAIQKRAGLRPYIVPTLLEL